MPPLASRPDRERADEHGKHGQSDEDEESVAVESKADHADRYPENGSGDQQKETQHHECRSVAAPDPADHCGNRVRCVQTGGVNHTASKLRYSSARRGA